MSQKIRLFTPGPTPVPQTVREATAEPMIHHRSEEFSKILASVRSRLKWLCDTDGEVLLFAASGSGGMEAAVSSLFEAGDHVVVIDGGKFGERWVELAAHYELDQTVIKVDWGTRVSVNEVMRAVKPATRGVLIQASETSTGVYHPIDEIGRALQENERNDVLFVVDAITALGVHEVSMKRDRIDVLVGGSQKALMNAPGLATVSLSPRAIECMGKTRPKSFYFSLARELKAQAGKNTTAFTPAISLVRGLDRALELIENEGKDALFARHRLMQRMTREAFRAMGMELYNSEEDAAWGITVVLTPPALDVKRWLKELRSEKGLWLAGGQGQLEGKVFRISHMGDMHPEELLAGLEIIEQTLEEVAPNASEKAGSKRALEIWEGKKEK